jgi:hypothetical protein
MLHENERHPRIRRQSAYEFGERFDAARRSTHRNHKKSLIRFCPAPIAGAVENLFGFAGFLTFQDACLIELPY